MTDDNLILKRIKESIMGFEIKDFVKWYNFDENQLQSIVDDYVNKNIVIKEILKGGEGEEDITIYIHQRWYNSNRCESCELLVPADETHICDEPQDPLFVAE